MIRIFLLILFFPILVNAQLEKQYINTNWGFKHIDSTQWHNAKVPGCIHTDLFANKLIQNPFYGNNEKNLQWIENQGWIYETSFKVEQTKLNSKSAHIIFEGLDTYSTIILNEDTIGESKNMFVKYEFDVKTILKEHNNLRIVFQPPLSNIDTNSKNIKYPGGEQVHIRKAPFMFGWDWSPRYATMGVWKNVYLEFYDIIKIEDIYVKQAFAKDSSANLDFEIELNNLKKGKYYIEIADKKNKIFVKKRIKLQATDTIINIKLKIKNPELWWPNGMGKAFLYNFGISIIKGKDTLDSKTIKTGIRTIELVNKKDKNGSSFSFKINNKDIFIKGANYIPQDIFLNQVSDRDYTRIILDARNSNMNMLRVWGGGVYEKDIFYNLCDEYGILVWQDFMFAGSMYPGDINFKANVSVEAIQQVVRLRNHPSIALWCGNNEISEGWHNWGWQKQMGYSIDDSLDLSQAYSDIFRNILPTIVKEYSSTAYWESSPQYGRGNPLSLSNGDSHYWGVWHDAEPFENFNTKVGRFMSEYGFQSYPDIKTIANFADSSMWSTDSKLMRAHQKHSRGNKLIKQYMKNLYDTIPENFEDFVYLSQLTQAYGIETAIKAHRRNKPYCMGTLYWQLNDCWPAISWSGIDYYGSWKAMQYKIKESYRPIIISTIKNNDSLDVYIISDFNEDKECYLNISKTNFYKNRQFIKTKKLIIAANSSKKYISIPISNIDSSKTAFYIEVTSMISKTYSSELVFLEQPKYIELPKEDYSLETTKINNEIVVKLRSKVLMKNVWVDIENMETASFSNNNFDLMPGESIDIRAKIKTGNLNKPIVRIRSLNKLLNQ
ncbi:MAG: glycoside hydrolase family 2 protein [Bacteroidetes bacterium]|nr:MAG: glycoside hydrolase family 2 protein [Bacteroidota bacterium]